MTAARTASVEASEWLALSLPTLFSGTHLLKRIKGAKRARKGPLVGGSEVNEDAFRRFFRARMRPLLDGRKLEKSGQVILVEEKPYELYHVASAVLTTTLATESDARIVSFQFLDRRSLRSRIQETWSASTDRTDVYRTMADERIVVRPKRRHEREARRLVANFAAARPSLRDLEAFTVEEIHLGDLFIDRIVQKGHVRIDPVHPHLLALMERMIARALAFRAVIAQREVVAVVTNDIAYSPGLPLKTAIAADVPAFIAHHRQVRRLDAGRPASWMDFFDYRGDFAELVEPERSHALVLAEEFLTSRLVGGDGFSVTGAPVWERDANPAASRAASGSVRTIIVASHSFWDAQHAVGSFLFPDFFSWLEHLVQLARRSEHRWRIKLHPDQRDVSIGVEPAVRALIADVPNVELIPNGVPNSRLIAEGVDLVTTVYGTVAMEFPWFGVPAVIAQPVSVHSSYSYALQPQTVEDLDRILLDPSCWEYPIDREEIHEYAFMNYLCDTNVLYGMLDQELLGVDPQSLSEWPCKIDWDEAISDQTFEGSMRTISNWVRSGSHGLNYWAGRVRRFEELRSSTRA